MKEGIWSGRTDHLENTESLRYYQIVELARLDMTDETCVIIGFESDEGVRKNKGKLEVAKAPDAIRA